MPGPESPPIAGWLLGFALGGFFDGVLLHQILQWHHLLSALEGRDLRFQVAADGYFHALMYVIAVAGLWLLWRDRNAGTTQGRRLAAAMFVGFGVWHLIDGVVSHWVLGIHRIRMDSDNRLFWDVLWLAVFGAVPLLGGWLLSRNLGKPPDVGGRNLAALIAAVIVSGCSYAKAAAGDGFHHRAFQAGRLARRRARRRGGRRRKAGLGGRLGPAGRASDQAVGRCVEALSPRRAARQPVRLAQRLLRLVTSLGRPLSALRSPALGPRTARPAP